MSILSSILHKILGAATSVLSPGAAQQQQSQSATPQSQGAQAQGAPNPQGQFQGAPSQEVPAQSNVDVTKILSEMEGKVGQKLNWRQSIVDLMKLLNLDSSLAARKELAQELGYSGALDGSAEMNLWLHSQVMQKLSQNGGKVPAELLN